MKLVRPVLHCLIVGLSLLTARPAMAEDGYELWLRYPALAETARADLAAQMHAIVPPPAPGVVAQAAVAELQRGLSGLLAREIPLLTEAAAGAVVLALPGAPWPVADSGLDFAALGPEGFALRRIARDGQPVTVIAAASETGLLYGVFALLRRLQSGQPVTGLDIREAPRTRLRLLNHWDNIDRTVERGYAGQSIWDWWRLPDIVDPRYTDYARANASVGINGAVLNNVNANALFLSARHIAKVAAVADVLRPWGMKVYLSVRWSAPIELGGLDTADPLDADVRGWWRDKADEIHAAIPDFGGFLVKANSEGQPGPQNYGRSHVEGANMLAAALQAHGGVVMWRAFVYSQDDPEDRVKQAYTEFKPLDGAFAGNVLVQVKNGPLDFQPREPFHPLFGAMPGTPLMMEFQVTQEYLGFSTHLAWLGALWEEVMQSDTLAQGAGSTVARVVDGSLHGQPLTGVAGVANIGSDRNWTGHPFGQANWYALGRLAWDPLLAADDIAREWLAMTFSSDPHFVAAAAGMMARSREAVVDYMTPLGLAHLMGTGHHYGPAPWVSDLARPEWNPFYYHRADAQGIGLDRTPSGSDAVSQYAAPLAARFGDLRTVPDEYLLWFHRLPWDHRMASGRTLWEELVARYDRGVAAVADMQASWAELAPYVDAQRFQRVSELLAVQAREAQWWRDASLAYFQHRSGLAWPPGVTPPAQSLEYYQSLSFPEAPGN